MVHVAVVVGVVVQILVGEAAAVNVYNAVLIVVVLLMGWGHWTQQR